MTTLVEELKLRARIAALEASLEAERTLRLLAHDEWQEAEAELKEANGHVAALERDLDEISQVIGKTLGYPPWADDPENAPEKPEGYVCVGDKFPIDMVRGLTIRFKVARRRLADLEQQIVDGSDRARRAADVAAARIAELEAALPDLTFLETVRRILTDHTYSMAARHMSDVIGAIRKAQGGGK